MREPIAPGGGEWRGSDGLFRTLMRPDVGWISPSRSFRVVDLPAPLGPRSP